MNYATGHALNAKLLMMNFPIEKLKMTSEQAMSILGNRHKKRVAALIWAESVKMVLDDIINNSDTFVLPTGKRKSELYVKTFQDERFRWGRQNGKWKDIDFLETNFSGPQLMFKFQRAGFMKEKPVYVDPERKLRMADRMNSGKSYY